MEENKRNSLSKLNKLYNSINKDILEDIHDNRIDLVELAKELDISVLELQDYLLGREQDYLMYRNIDASIKKLIPKSNRK